MRKSALSLAVFLICAGCSFSPEPDYYSLAPVTGAPVATPVSLKIERPVLPAYLDRPEIVRQSGDYRIDINDSDRWAEPLDTMFERVLSEDLRQRLPSGRIVTERDTGLKKPQATLEIDIEQFNDTDQGIVLNAYVTIAPNDGCTQVSPTEFRITAMQSGKAGLSEAIGKLADFVAQKTVVCSVPPPS